MVACNDYLKRAVEDINKSLFDSIDLSNNTHLFITNTDSHRFNPFHSYEPTYYIIIGFFLSLFGIIGNVLNIIVLKRKRLSKALDRAERTVNFGLTSLALSDLLFCLIFFLSLFSEDKLMLTPFDRGLSYYFKIYKVSVIFLKS